MIIDTPPLGEISDALRLLSFVDEVVIVVRPGNSDRVGLSTTADLLAGRAPIRRASSWSATRPGQASSYYAYGHHRRRELFVEEPVPERTTRSTH